MHPRHWLASFAAVALLGAAAPAYARHVHHPGDKAADRIDREARHAERDWRYNRGGGRGDLIYPPPYDRMRAWYGGRGDDRWRWYDGARPDGIGSPIPWYGAFIGY